MLEDRAKALKLGDGRKREPMSARSSTDDALRK